MPHPAKIVDQAFSKSFGISVEDRALRQVYRGGRIDAVRNMSAHACATTFMARAPTR
jgi:hypothetical protein